MTSPADRAATIIDSLAGGATGWVLKVGKSVPEPDQVITLYDTGGRTPNPKWAVDYPTIMAQVRGKPNEYNVAWAKAREVRDALLGLESQDFAEGRWVSVTCPGDIGFVGYDDQERPMVSINFNLIIEPVTTGNREVLPG